MGLTVYNFSANGFKSLVTLVTDVNDENMFLHLNIYLCFIHIFQKKIVKSGQKAEKKQRKQN